MSNMNFISDEFDSSNSRDHLLHNNQNNYASKDSIYHVIAENVYRSYVIRNMPIKVLKGINLNVKKQEKLFLHGPSGAGKTTLLYTLAGLEAPDKGNVFIKGTSIYYLKQKNSAMVRNLQLGFIFQNYFLLPELTALENVMLPSLVSKKKNFELANLLLSEVGLFDRKTHLPSELSGGEQQRVAIARALINQPEIIFADEPTGNLDSKTGNLVIELLIKLTSDLKRTLILVTHDKSLTKYSDRKITLIDGKLTQD